jgi:hypothetical protein
MNGLTSVGSWENQQPLMMAVYSIIDAKIDYIELKTRKFLSKLSKTETLEAGIYDNENNMPTMPKISLEKNDAAQVFEELENLSRSITLLENMKFDLNEENAHDMLLLLDDVKITSSNDIQSQQPVRRRFAYAA